MATYTAPGVYVEEIDTGPKPLTPSETAIPAFIGYTATRPDGKAGFRATLVTSWQGYLDKFGGFDRHGELTAMLPLAVKGYFDEGGKKAYIISIAHRSEAEEPAALELKSAHDADEVAATIKAIEPAKAEGSDDSSPPEVKIAEGALDTEGNITYDVEVWPPGAKEPVVTAQKVAQGELKTKLEESKLLTVEVSNGSLAEFRVPGTGVVALRKKPGPIKEAVAVPEVDGSEADGTGIRGLMLHEDVTMLICPDLDNIATKWTLVEDKDKDMVKVPKRGDPNPVIWKGVQQAMLAHCQKMGNRMAILDTPRDIVEPQAATDWRKKTAMYDTAYGALYYPWIKVVDPHPGADGLIEIPPSGHVAGVWARNDSTRGVWKAPANEPLNTVQGVAKEITQVDQEGLNPEGINAIRSFGSRGIRIWGARTLSATDPNWKYINVRRLFNMIEQTILEQTQWVVFEPNDMALWERVSRTIRGFLNTLWRDGALFGATPEEAYSVRCDAELNPRINQQNGLLITEIAIAPVFPAEFVVFRLSQKTQSE